MFRGLAVACLSASLVVAQTSDTNCPAYPAAKRVADAATIALQNSATRLIAARSGVKRAKSVTGGYNRSGFIDDAIFGALDQAGVTPAPLTSDAEFVRRIYLDMIGRIPTADQTLAFLNDTNPDKRNTLIDTLMASPAWIDNWTYFFADYFAVTQGYYNVISIPAQQRFYFFLRDFVNQDRSYKELASDLITASGDATQNGAVNFIVKGWQNGDPSQDTFDTLANLATVKFLGFHAECISCHNGRAHLEPINAYLTPKKRTDFWGLSAFFSRISFTFFPVDIYRQSTKAVLVDRPSGSYTSAIDPNNPGPRPLRYGGPYNPAFLLTGETPASGNWRQEFAKLLTNNPQFAKATANLIWAHFFSSGIVDPVDGWDLARQDPNNVPSGWTLQPTHPALMEALGKYFSDNNYSIRKLVRLIAQSTAYQLSGRYDSDWRPEYARLWARHEPQRMTAEQIYDSIITATGTQVPMYIEGFANPVYYANQLPDVTEPRDLYNATNQFVQTNGTIRNILSNFGRPNWNDIPRDSKSTVLRVLFMMNDNSINFRTFATHDAPGGTLVARLLSNNVSDTDSVRQLFLSTLSRYPTDDELSKALKYSVTPRENWLSDIQWVLLNKLDFLFNY
jgi:hypothetical protein